MSPRQAAAARWAITTARALERAVEYGIRTGPAARDYDRARAALRRAKGLDGGAR